MANIYAISAFTDNYIWAICDANKRYAAIVDPGTAAPVLDFLAEQQLQLTHILVTHHHHDHTGGIKDLLQHTKVPVLDTHNIGTQQQVELVPQQLVLNVQAIPGHTLDHIAFYNDQILFCGDTLFSAGCGRVFEGTSAQMLNSLHFLKKLTAAMYCGHEYTVNNLKFALQVEPNNPAITQRLMQAEQLRAAGLPTLPAAMSAELKYNPFLRTDQPAVIAAVQQHYHETFNNEVAVFAALREWKNTQ